MCDQPKHLKGDGAAPALKLISLRDTHEPRPRQPVEEYTFFLCD